MTRTDVAADDWAWVAKAPALVEYLNRVGARTMKSFRKHLVEIEIGKYKKALGSVVIDKDGALTCWGVEEPSKEEATKIAAEVAAAGWPRAQAVSAIVGAPEELLNAPSDKVFEFRDRQGFILMVQVRRDDPKVYIPWTYWSDGRWRQMEPDGDLPLYGLDKIADNMTVFLHEGAKSARYVQWMIEAKSREAKAAFDAHPWATELSAAAHIGWIGGAPNPHRTDWSPIKSLGKDARVYLVADNDEVGVSAVSAISRRVLRHMTAIVFDDSFPASFDLADPWPGPDKQPSWWNGPRYLGPSFSDMCRPATWATKIVKSGKQGRARIDLRDEFRGEWYLSMKPHLLIHRRLSDKMYDPDVFNRVVAPFSDAEDTVRLLAREFSVHADGITYRPSTKADFRRITTVDGKRLINTFRPAAIVPKAGDLTLFTEFMEYLFPVEEDRALVQRWCATLIAKPDVRMRYGMLLISERQGVGKSSLVDTILAPLVGRWNVSAPNEHQVTESGFNGWAAHKRLCSISEIYSGHSRKTYDRLKQVISDDVIEVNEKFQAAYTLENWLHVAACSNSIRALHMDDEDRRWLIPRVAEELKDKDWWAKFHKWLRSGGLEAIAAWAERYVGDHGPVQTGDRAPVTVAKKEVVNASRSEGARIAFDLAVDLMARGGEYLFLVDEVRLFVAMKRKLDINDKRLESGLTLRKALIEGGLKEPRHVPNTDKRMRTDDGLHYVVATFDIPLGTEWSAIVGKKSEVM